METPPLRILMADKQTIFREGLSNVLSKQPGLEVVAGAADGKEVLKLAADLKPDLLLLDFSLPVYSAIDVIRRLAGASRVIVLAGAQEKAWICDLFRVGARGVVLRESPTGVLIKAILSVAKGMYWNLDHGIGEVEVVLREVERGQKPTAPKTFGLTARELEIISAVVSGHSNRQIAERMSISEGTIKHHLTNIFDKLGVFNRLELALFAIHHGLGQRTEHSA